jgi:hypothetical protein
LRSLRLGAANLGPNALYIKPDIVLFDAIRVTGTSSKVPKQLLTALDAVKSSMTIEKAPGVKVLFQMKMILDPYSFTEVSQSTPSPVPQIYLEIKPTTVLQKGVKISDLVFDCFGHHILVLDTDTKLRALKAILTDLKVHRKYQTHAEKLRVAKTGAIRGSQMDGGSQSAPSLAKSQTQASNTATAIPDGGTTVTLDTPTLVVHDIKIAGDVPTLHVGNDKFSVLKYFETGMYMPTLHSHLTNTDFYSNIEVGEKILYPALPLARIGHDVWVPLEMLKSAEIQVLSTLYL